MGAARSHPGIQEKRREEKRRGRRKREREEGRSVALPRESAEERRGVIKG